MKKQTYLCPELLIEECETNDNIVAYSIDSNLDDMYFGGNSSEAGDDIDPETRIYNGWTNLWY